TDIPGQSPRRVLVEVRQIVREGAAVQRVAGDADRGPELQEPAASYVDVTATPVGDGLADRLHDRVWGAGIWGAGLWGAAGLRGGGGGHGRSPRRRTQVDRSGLIGIATVVRSPWSA